VNRILATLSFLTLAALVVVAIRSVASNRAFAGEFQLIKEAEMPAGFPEPTPVGQVMVKQYPAYRRASASGVAEFWTLFRHIKENGIQMTAPVEMDYGDPRKGGSRERTMSFLYERPDQGAVGRQGNVEVIDVPATKVISIGCRGSQTSAAVADARERLMKYLAEDRDRHTIAGPMRVMGYNSPFVPRDRNYFEVQIPVRDSKSG
jgi:hypothetical protein